MEINCGRFTIAQQKGECIYRTHCIHKECPFLNNSKPSGCLRVISSIVFVFIIFCAIINLLSNDYNESNAPSEYAQNMQQPVEPVSENFSKQIFTGNLTNTQIDKCKFSFKLY